MRDSDIATFSGFSYRGTYTVTFLAEDNEGFVTDSTPVRITCLDGPEYMPENPVGEATGNAPAPLVSASSYHSGERLLVTLPENMDASRDIYIGLASDIIPALFLITDTNSLMHFSGTLEKWQDRSNTILDFVLPDTVPKGSYTIYLLSVPAGTPDPLAVPETWQLGQVTFQLY